MPRRDPTRFPKGGTGPWCRWGESSKGDPPVSFPVGTCLNGSAPGLELAVVWAHLGPHGEYRAHEARSLRDHRLTRPPGGHREWVTEIEQ